MASQVAAGNVGFVGCASGRLLKQDASSVARSLSPSRNRTQNFSSLGLKMCGRILGEIRPLAVCLLASGLILTILWIMLIGRCPARLIRSTVLMMLSDIHI